MMQTTLALALGLGLMSGAALAASAWTGGDDLPTNPLACDDTPGAAVAKHYDGGAPTNAPDRKGKPIKVVDVPKLIGIGYFNATTKGILEAAAELGNVDAKTDGPTQGQHRRADHLHRQLHHLAASTASCSPPTIRSPSRRC